MYEIHSFLSCPQGYNPINFALTRLQLVYKIPLYDKQLKEMIIKIVFIRLQLFTFFPLQ